MKSLFILVVKACSTFTAAGQLLCADHVPVLSFFQKRYLSKANAPY